MKIPILPLLILTSTLLIAQTDPYAPKPVVIEDITKAISRGEQPGFRVRIYQAEKKEIDNAWSKVIRNDTKSKVENVNNEFSIIWTNLKDISQKPINVYAIINPYQTYVELNAFFELDSVFITKASNETEYLAARKFVRDFAIEKYREALAAEIKTEEKKLSDLEGELDKLVKENDKLHKKISEENRSIDNNEEKIRTSELDQDRVKKQVQAKKSEVSRLKASKADDDAIKEAKKELKDLNNEVGKLEKQEDKLHKNNVKSEANIREAERDIADNEQNMNLKRKEITIQKEHLLKLQRKLEAIK